MSVKKIENAKIDRYQAFLREKYRPPSKGGNTRALHLHLITIAGEKYSFFALGTQQWMFKSDTVSFEYEIKNGYKNILKDTVTTIDKDGQPVVRGNRDYKHRLRTANQKPPGRD